MLRAACDNYGDGGVVLSSGYHRLAGFFVDRNGAHDEASHRNLKMQHASRVRDHRDFREVEICRNNGDRR